jgi:hypothetical protein
LPETVDILPQTNPPVNTSAKIASYGIFSIMIQMRI